MNQRPVRALRPRKSPSQARSRATVATILEGAARVFARRGYAAATTNHIAAAAGVSVGSLYEYFPNKDALLIALVEDHITEARERLDAVAAVALRPSSTLHETIDSLVQAMCALHASNPALHRVLFEEAPLPPQTRRRLEEIERAIAERIATYLATRPEVTAPDPHLAAMMLVQTVEALTHRLVIHGEATDRAVRARELAVLAAAYLTHPR